MTLAIHIETINQFAVRYTRNNLKEAGYSLAFFDNSALGDLGFVDNNGTENTQLTKKFIDFCSSHKVRPVLSIEIIGELVKSLPNPSNPRYEGLTIKKEITLKTLKQSDLLWALPVRALLDLEWYNLQQQSARQAHDALYVFSDFPLYCWVEEDTKRKRYPCDENLPYVLAPDKPTVVYDGDITKWFKDEILCSSALSEIQDAFQDFKNTIVDDPNKKLQMENADNITSPFIWIWNKGVVGENVNGQTLPNERLDTLHGTFALSYCDKFITNDNRLIGRCKHLKETLNLGVAIMRTDEFWEEINVSVGNQPFVKTIGA